MTVFKLPDLGEGLSEAEIVRWHIKVGDYVAVDAPMLSVETAKAVVEVPAPLSGTVTVLHGEPGDRLDIGAPLVEFATDEPSGASASADSGTVVGHMPSQAEDESALAALEAANAVVAPRVRAVPAARALARSLGVDLSTLTGTGRSGLITLDDLLRMAGGHPPADPDRDQAHHPQRVQQGVAGRIRSGQQLPAPEDERHRHGDHAAEDEPQRA